MARQRLGANSNFAQAHLGEAQLGYGGMAEEDQFIANDHQRQIRFEEHEQELPQFDESEEDNEVPNFMMIELANQPLTAPPAANSIHESIVVPAKIEEQPKIIVKQVKQPTRVFPQIQLFSKRNQLSISLLEEKVEKVFSQTAKILKQEVKRFKVLSVLTSEQKTKLLQQNTEYKKLYENTVEQEKIDSGSSQLLRLNMKRPSFSSLTFLRKSFRVFYHLAVMAIIFIIFLIGYLLTVRVGSLKIPIAQGLNNLMIDTGNCLINIKDTSGSDMLLEYNTLKSLSAYIDSDRTQTTTTVQNKNEVITLKLLNAFDQMEFCIIDLLIPKKFTFSTISLKCRNNTECTIVQGSQILNSLRSMNFKSIGQGQMNLNLANIRTPSLSVSGLSSNLIINNADISNKVKIQIDVGTVIIQTLRSFKLLFNTSSQSICSSAPSFFNPIHSECFVSGDDETKQFKNSTGYCKGSVFMCDTETDCQTNTIPIYNISVRIGGIYTNVIQKKGYLPSQTNQIFKNGQFDEGLQFDLDFQERILQTFNTTSMDADFIFQFQIGGNKHMQSSSVTHWMYFSNPSFAQIRPWWLSTLSATLLTAQSYDLQGFLNPGICPYVSHFNLDQMLGMSIHVTLEIQVLVNSLFPNVVGLPNFIQPMNRPKPPLNKDIWMNTTSNGVEWYYKNSKDIVDGITEDWYTIQKRNGNLLLSPISASENGLIIAAIVLSVAVAIGLSCLCSTILKGVIVTINERLLEVSIHHGNYCKSDSAVQNPDPLAILNPTSIKLNIGSMLEKTKWTVFLRDAPLFSQTIDYYGYMTAQRFLVDSTGTFFKYLFREATIEENKKFIDNELDEGELLSIKEKQLKNYYEKFCFLNHYQPRSLLTPQVTSILHQYKFDIVDDTDKSAVFLKICPKKIIQVPSNEDLDTSDTIDLFIRMNYDITNILADSEWIEDFEEKYQSFAKLYQFPIESIRAENIIQKYKLDQAMHSRKKLVKNIHSEEDQDLQIAASPNERFKRVIEKLKRYFGPSRNKIYLIDKEQLEFHFQILSDPTGFIEQNLQHLKPAPTNFFAKFKYVFGCYDQRKVTLDSSTSMKPINVVIETLYYRFWYLIDLIIVLSHYAVAVILGAPLLVIIFIAKFSYAEYSLYSPEDNLTVYDILYRPWVIPFFFVKLEIYIQIIIGVLSYFVIVNYLQDLLVYIFAEFPEDASFRLRYKNLRDHKSLLVVSMLQWIFLFVLYLIICFYLGLILIWLLLGAIINPNNFLVYATSVTTLVTIVTGKAQEIEDLFDKAIGQIKEVVDSVYQDTVKEIAGAVLGIAKDVVDEAKSALNSDVANDVGDMAEMMGFGDELKQLKSSAEQSMSQIENGLKNPDDLVKQMNGLKSQMVEKAKAAFIMELTQQGLSNELSEIITKGLVEKPDSMQEPISVFIESQTQGRINGKIIMWLFETIQTFKNEGEKLTPQKVEQQLIRIIKKNNVLIEGCMDTVTNYFFKMIKKQNPQITEQQLQDLKTIINLVMKMIILINENRKEQLLPMMKTIFQICSHSMVGLEQDNLQIVYKIVDIIDQYFKKTLDESTLLLQMNEFSSMVSIPDDVMMLITILLSQGQRSVYKSGKLIISNEKQLQFFFQQICNRLVGSLLLNSQQDMQTDMKGLNFYSDVVAAGMMLLFKLSKGQIQPNEIQILVEKVMFRLIEKTYKKQNTNEAIKNQLQGEITTEQIEFLDQGVNFISTSIPMLLSASHNHFDNFQDLIKAGGVQLTIIKDIVSIGTKASWALIGQFENKRTGLVNAKDQYLNRKLVQQIAQELRMKTEVMVAIIQLLNGELDFTEDIEIFDEMIFFLAKALNIREEAKINELRPVVQILLAQNYRQAKIAIQSYQDFAGLYDTNKNDNLNPVNRIVELQTLMKSIYDAGDYKPSPLKQMNSSIRKLRGSMFQPAEDLNSNQMNKEFSGSLFSVLQVESASATSALKPTAQNLLGCILRSFDQKQQQKIQCLVGFLSIKTWVKKLSKVQAQQIALNLSQCLNYKIEVLSSVIKLVQFDDLDDIVQTAVEYIQKSVDIYAPDFNVIKLNVENIEESLPKVKAILQHIVGFIIKLEERFDYSNLKPLIQAFLPEWIIPGLDFFVAELFDLPVKPTSQAMHQFTLSLLEFIGKMFRVPNFQQFNDLIRGLINQDVETLERTIQIRIREICNLDDTVSQLMLAIATNDIMRIMTILFKDKENSIFSVSSLNILINCLGAFSVANQRGIERIVQRENAWLIKNKGPFRWNQNFLWVMGHLKFFFTRDLEAFAEFSQLLLKKVCLIISYDQLFEFDSIPTTQVISILSLFTEQPNLSECAMMLKVPVSQLEFANLVCRLTLGDQDSKLDVINELGDSVAMKSFFKNLGIDVKELSYLLKFVTKNLGAIEWKEFLSTINLGSDTNKDIILGLLAMTANFDHMIPSDWDKLKANYCVYRDQRASLFENIFYESFEPYELLYNLRRGNISNLSMFQDNGLNQQTKIFCCRHIAELVGSIPGIMFLDDSSERSLDEESLRKYLKQADSQESQCLRNSFASVVQTLYNYLGISPLVVMGIMGNEPASILLDDNMKERYGVSLRWEQVKNFCQEVESLDLHTKYCLVEAEFLLRICNEMRTFGLDDISSIERAKQKRLDYEVIKQTLQQVIQQKSTQRMNEIVVNLADLYKCNPVNNSNLWNTEYPITNTLMLVALRQLRELAGKSLNEKQASKPQKTQGEIFYTRLAKGLKSAHLIDFVLTTYERILFVDYHDLARQLKKSDQVMLLQLSLCNKEIVGGVKIFDVLPYHCFQLLNYASLTDPRLIAKQYCESEVVQTNALQHEKDVQQFEALEEINPFIVDFSSNSAALGKSRSFKDDPQVKIKAVCRQVMDNFAIYQKCFISLVQMTQLADNGNNRINRSQQGSNQEGQPLQPQLKAAVLDEDPNHALFRNTTQWIFKETHNLQVLAELSDDKMIDSKLVADRSVHPKVLVNVSQVQNSKDWLRYFVMFRLAGNGAQGLFKPNSSDKMQQKFKDLNELISQQGIQDDYVKQFTRFLQQIENQKPEEIQTSILMQTLLKLNLKGSQIYSKNTNRLRQVMRDFSISNPQIKVGSESSIDVALEFINYLTTNAQNAKQSLINILQRQVSFRSHSINLLKIVQFIISPQQTTQDTVNWIIQNCLGGNKDLFYGIVVPLLRLLKEQNYPNEQLSEEISYFAFGDDLDASKGDSIENYYKTYQKYLDTKKIALVNKNRYGEALENLIAKAQSIPPTQRKILKILISCFMGEIEGWMSLMEELNVFEAFGNSLAETIEDLLCKLFIGFKGAGLRQKISIATMKGMSILKLVSANPDFEQQLFAIISGIEVNKNSEFEKVQQIVSGLAKKQYIQLIQNIDTLMGYVSIPDAQYANDIKALIQLIIAFSAIKTLDHHEINRFLVNMTEGEPSLLQKVIDNFSPVFLREYVDLKTLSPIIQALLKFQLTHDYNVIFEEFLKFASKNKDNKALIDLVQPIKFFMSIQAWTKIKYLPSQDSAALREAFPTLLYPFIYMAELALGKDKINTLFPDFQNNIDTLLFTSQEGEDRFLTQIKLLKQIRGSFDPKKASNLFSPSCLGFLMKSFEEHQAMIGSFLEQKCSPENIKQFAETFLKFFSKVSATNSEELENNPKLVEYMSLASVLFLVLGGQSGIIKVSKDELIMNMVDPVVAVLRSLMFKALHDQLHSKEKKDPKKLEELEKQVKQAEELFMLIFQCYVLVSNHDSLNPQVYASILKKLASFFGPKGAQIEEILDLIAQVSDNKNIETAIAELPKKIIHLFADEGIFNPEQSQFLDEFIIKISKLGQIFTTIKDEFEKFVQNGFNMQKLFDLIDSLYQVILSPGQAKQVHDILSSVLALQQLNFKDISEEFFIFMKIPPEQAHLIKMILVDSKAMFENPQKLIEQKSNELMSYALKKSKTPAAITMIQNKLKDGRSLSKEDLFQMIDTNQNKLIDIQEFQRFLKRTGINLTDHKIQEIFTSIKGDSMIPGQQLSLDENEFQKAMQYIQKQSIMLSLEAIGLTKEILSFGLIGLTTLLLIVFAFIFVGISAFSIPGTFGSVVNSIFPVGIDFQQKIAGGGGLTKAGSKNQEKLFDPKKIRDVVRNAMKIVQSVKI